MGRHAGWIAVMSGLAGGGDVILIPERPFDIEEVCALIRRRRDRGKSFSIVVAAEGAQPKQGTLATQGKDLDEFGHVKLGGIGYLVGREVEKRTGIETRVTVLGHIQRGGTPTAFDRILATRYGVAAVDLVERKQFGRMAALRGNAIIDVSLEEATRAPKLVDMDLFKTAEIFFG
jgi:6-phosphofructokinase 1